jgi:hypothetical protein
MVAMPRISHMASRSWLLPNGSSGSPTTLPDGKCEKHKPADTDRRVSPLDGTNAACRCHTDASESSETDDSLQPAAL